MIILFLLLTVFVYLIFPTIVVAAQGKLPKDTAKKYALINSIVCAAIFMLIRGLTGSDAVGAAGFAPAVFYYFIAKSIMQEKDVQSTPQENKAQQEPIDKEQSLKENSTKRQNNEQTDSNLDSQDNKEI